MTVIKKALIVLRFAEMIFFVKKSFSLHLLIKMIHFYNNCENNSLNYYIVSMQYSIMIFETGQGVNIFLSSEFMYRG